ncbi:RNA 2'-phosphotransferase [Fimbriimonas ginsengisoli]|uniref:Phosphate acetyltransferase n=1 Tax=Fimbriimonas ginsengisoli Gsoil 348 TaxID=661478 RepID=A0A068NV60_FIMGI|nr:RNA 2'-phosphotransferase [Fimbriimonas ginsengisoli]AIE87257.1 phosphate acetyltransferase [Fimbriimonas ginsengisoli Gsoil 348]
MSIRTDPRQFKGLSKFVSLVLRHEPGLAGLELEVGGWVSVDRLIEGRRT